MICWKSIDLNRDFGMYRLVSMSFLIGLLAFISLYVPISILHGVHHADETGIFLFLIALVLLPAIHSFMHILPILAMKKSAKLILQKKDKRIPSLTYYTNVHLTKKASLFVVLAPTIFITVPGIIASYLFIDFYVYILLLTAIHIGITFIDFLYAIQIAKAPTKSYIENGSGGFDILLKDLGR